jgi:hypothetical protein
MGGVSRARDLGFNHGDGLHCEVLASRFHSRPLSLIVDQSARGREGPSRIEMSVAESLGEEPPSHPVLQYYSNEPNERNKTNTPVPPESIPLERGVRDRMVERSAKFALLCCGTRSTALILHLSWQCCGQ